MIFVMVLRRCLLSVVYLGLIAGCSSNDPVAEEGSGSQPAVAGSTGPDTFDVSGLLKLTSDEGVLSVGDTKGSRCFGDTGFDDIQGGTIVIVRDVAGVRVGVGELGEGFLEEDRRRIYATCNFLFDVDDILDEGDVFTIEVGTRGEVRMGRDDVEYAELSLG